VREPADSLQPPGDFSGSRLETELEGQLSWLGRAARGLGFSSSDAEDLVQTVAVTFLEVMPRYEGRSSVRTFLFGILRRKAAEMRRRARRLDQDDAALESTPSSSDGESRVSNAQLGQVLRDCIEQLPQKQRSAAQLRFQQEQETEVVGQGLGVSANYIGVLIHRAREHLRDCVGRHGFLA
jgi:RNA polymerase sigma-70 factor (ECF subfamily)